MPENRVIIIDDDIEAARGYERVLEARGCRVASAASVDEALPLMAEDSAGGLLLSVAPPVLDNLRALLARLETLEADASPGEAAGEMQGGEEEPPLSWTARTMRIARNAGLFLAAPFTAVLYSLLLPFVAAFVFAKGGWQALIRKKEDS